jgi:hypothetical protein
MSKRGEEYRRNEELQRRAFLVQTLADLIWETVTSSVSHVCLSMQKRTGDERSVVELQAVFYEHLKAHAEAAALDANRKAGRDA